MALGQEPAPVTRQRIVDLLDRMSALLDDVELDLDDPARRARAWGRVRAVHDTIDELLRDEGLIDLTDDPDAARAAPGEVAAEARPAADQPG